MRTRNPRGMSRRQWLTSAAACLGSCAMLPAIAGERPEVTRPRATSGDVAFEPAWEQRLTVTVGPGSADIPGVTDKAIQAGVDYIARFGGGTVKLLPGEYTLRNAVCLRTRVRIEGSGPDTVLTKAPSVETTLAVDSDWYDQEITLTDASGFLVGDGVCLITENPDTGGREVVKRTLVAHSGSRFKLDRALRENFWVEKQPVAVTLFPLITAEEASELAVENLTLDGNRANNAHLDGNYAGCLWFQDCSRIVLRGVTARNYNGDGMSWQICHDVVVENCHSHDNADLGMHPGSGSQRPTITGNRIERNGTGLFFCWGVKYGLAEGNVICDNVDYGISIGHRDDENLVRDNDVLRNGKCGVLFRPERGIGYTASGNRVEENRIIDNGPEDGAAVDIQGVTSGNTLARNEIRETRGPASRAGIRIGAETGENTLQDNHIEGFAVAVQDLRRK
ncbi:MAG: right-handed parallel beta-helix repeat-containing protein [Candidatus Hydrogenedentes bacterium]|nr:right-handed parallel beta-helix repeat-containing protein [Candidatus Hydrogenedentota bacterium]